MEEEMVTTSAAAKELDILPSTVHLAIKEGRLPVTLKYGRKLISRADLDAYKLRTRPDGEKPRGRPKKQPDGEKPRAESETDEN